MRSICYLLLLLTISACQVLNPPNIPATLSSENMGYVAEATALAGAATREAQDVELTAAAAETRTADIQTVNRVLLATVRAGDPIESQGVVANVIATPVGLQPDQRWFVKTGLSTRVRDSDGCVEDPRIQFTNDVNRIFATARVFNINSGVRLSAIWYYEGNQVFDESWVVDRNSSDMCFWFDISRSIVELQPGNWSVRLFADGFQLEEAMTFSIMTG